MTGLQQRLIYLLVLVNVGIHFGELPSWIPSLGMVFVLWRWVADLVPIPCPGRYWAAILAAICAFAIWAEFGKVIGDPASTALLITMVALKSFEIRGYRDLMIITYLCLLLLMAKLLNLQSIGMTVFMFVDVIAILALMHLYHTPSTNRRLPWRSTLKLVTYSLPILLTLFFLFPRFNFSLLKRAPESSSQVGFSGHLRPGSVSDLAQGSQVAFRAFFRGGSYVPPMDRLYWRGAVLTENKGLNWDPSSFRGRVNSVLSEANPVEVMVEDGGSSWVFTLDWPVTVLMANGNRQLELRRGVGATFGLGTPLMPRETYRFSFEPTSRFLNTNPTEIEGSMTINPPTRRVHELIESWHPDTLTTADKIARINEYFIKSRFEYTLTPPETEDLEEFLFFTRRGFCEHFAGATASLLRMMKVPARVVVGYQGGAFSLMRDYLIVSQRDAHAWLEYWDRDRRQWTRLDPISWIAPERVALGGQAFFERQNPTAIAGIEAKWLRNLFGQDVFLWLARSYLLVDQAEIAWLTFLFRFDLTYQRELFARIGWKEISKSSLFLLTILGVIVASVSLSWTWRMRTRPRLESGLKIYRELCRKLAAAGLERQFSEGPRDLAHRAMVRWPDQAEILGEIFQRLILIRYGGAPLGEREKAEIRLQMRRLKFR